MMIYETESKEDRDEGRRREELKCLLKVEEEGREGREDSTLIGKEPLL